MKCMTFGSFQLNPKVNVYQRKYVTEVRRCEEMERKLCKQQSSPLFTRVKKAVFPDFMRDEMLKCNIVPADIDTQPLAPKPGEISELEVLRSGFEFSSAK